MAYHDEYPELISAAIDGALSPEETEKINAHLAQCPECKALYEELSALHAVLSDLPPVEVPADLHDRIMQAVAAEQVLPFAPPEKKKSSVRWQRWLASAAVFAVVLLGTWSSMPWDRGSGDQKPQSAELQQPLLKSTEAASEASMVTEAPDNAIPAPTGAPVAAPAPAPAAFSPQVVSDVESAEIGGQPEAKSKDADACTGDAPAEADPSATQPPAVLRMAPEPESGTGNSEILDSGLRSTALPQGAPVPQQADPVETLPAAPEETGAPKLQPFMVSSMLTTNEAAEPTEVTVQDALERLVAYIFEYSGYDSVEYISEGEGLYAQVTAQGCGGTVYLLPEDTDETLYWFEFHPEIGDDVYYYTVDRLTGEPTSLLGEGD